MDTDGRRWISNAPKTSLFICVHLWFLLLAPVFGQATQPQKGFEFPWGAGYRTVRASVSDVIEDKKGDILRFRRGDVEYVYYFNRPMKIRNVEVEELVTDGKKTFVFKRTELEGAVDEGSARLFSVSINLPYVPFSGSLPDDLIKQFGKPANVTGDSIDMENLSAYLRVHLETYRGKRYLKRLVLTSKEEAGRLNLERVRLKQDEEKAIRAAIERAKNPAKPGSYNDSGSEQRVSMPGIPDGLEAELIQPAPQR